MSEQYYSQEDILPNTPEQAIENWEAQSNSLSTVVPEVAQLLNDTGAILGDLYAKAEAANDQQAMQIISISWTNMQTMGNQTVQMDATRQSAAAAIQVINDERKRVTEILDELETAIHHQDDTNPQIKDLIEAVREEAMEDAAEQAEEYALEYAFEVSYDNISEHLQELTGCDWKQANRFIGILQGDYHISDYQSALLKELLDGLLIERDGEPS